MTDSDKLDGCGLDFQPDPTQDSDAPFVALFAEVPDHEVEGLAVQYRALLS